MKNILHFLRELRVHNNREWFNAHKEEYLTLRKRFENYINQLIALLSEEDEELRGLEASSCLFRIYRDIRFSPDKTPYKTHFAAYMARGGKNTQRAGYYLHIEPDNCLLAGGIWDPQPPLLKALRQAIYDNCEEFKEIVQEPKFKRLYHGLDNERALKIMPRPFPKDFPYPEWLKQRDYDVIASKADTDFETDDWLPRTAKELLLLRPINRFLNYTYDEMNE
ncbi:MAG: DUF2461 domain-containing protein [Porphyromonadaceae bacterium]|nr:DUF2461 domain-containing protein [Porphyromonadaceae bacterium]